MHFFFQAIVKSNITGSPLIYSINSSIFTTLFQNNIYIFKRSRPIIFQNWSKQNTERISNMVQHSICQLNFFIFVHMHWPPSIMIALLQITPGRSIHTEIFALPLLGSRLFQARSPLAGTRYKSPYFIQTPHKFYKEMTVCLPYLVSSSYPVFYPAPLPI